jgi:hypothetical protein
LRSRFWRTTFSAGESLPTGESLYVLLDHVLYEYTLGDTLTLKSTMELDDDYEELSADQNGNLYLTGFMSPMLTIKDGASHCDKRRY